MYFSAPLGKCHRVQLLDHMIRVYLVLWETTKPPSKVAVTCCIPTGNLCECLLPHALSSIWCCRCSRFGYSSQCAAWSCFSHLDFSDDIWRAAPFRMFIGRLCTFGQVSIKIFGSFLVRFIFLLLSFKYSQYSLYNSPSSHVFCNCFLPVCGLSCPSLYIIFRWVEFWIVSLVLYLQRHEWSYFQMHAKVVPK